MLGEIVGVVLVVVVVVAVVVFGCLKLAESGCENVGRETGRQVRWQANGGCFIETKEGFVPLDTWRVVEK